MMSTLDLEEILGKATNVSLTDNDVVFGRGGFTNRHPANIEYLKLLSEHEEAYMDCKRKYQKLLSLCIIHQLRSKGVRFLKKDDKNGAWKTVKLSQCRLKISQRLRERAPFIKLEQLNATRGLAKMIRPATAVPSISAPEVVPASYPQAVPPVHSVTVSDASSDEEDGTESLLGLDDTSSFADVFLLNAFEQVLGGDNVDNGNLASWAEEQFGNKRYADSIITRDAEEPQYKRARKVSMDEDDYANMLMKEASLLDDISVASLAADDEIEFRSMDAIDLVIEDVASPDAELFEYLQVLF